MAFRAVRIVSIYAAAEKFEMNARPESRVVRAEKVAVKYCGSRRTEGRRGDGAIKIQTEEEEEACSWKGGGKTWWGGGTRNIHMHTCVCACVCVCVGGQSY